MESDSQVPIILKDWAFVAMPTNAYTAPEMIQYRFVGKAYGHPNYEDGDKIGILPKGPASLSKEGTIVYSTSGRKYLLQGVQQAYKEMYPDCEQRILALVKN